MKKPAIIDQIIPSEYAAAVVGQLKPYLPREFAHCVVDVFHSCPSTSEYVKQAVCTWASTPDAMPIHVCISEQQTAGRGQHGRNWLSPVGNVYLSLFMPCALPVAGYLSLIVSYCLCCMPVFTQLTEHLNQQKTKQPARFGIKWANDIGVLTQDKQQHKCFNKLAGVLIEPVHLANSNNKGQGVVIGVGINLVTAPDISQLSGVNQLGYATTCLADWQICTDINSVYLQTILAVSEAMQVYDETDLHSLPDYFAKAYAPFDLLYQQPLNIQQASIQWRGQACGINAQGGLQLLLADGEVKTIYNGQVNFADNII